jgi:hypothetical protein
MTKPFTRIHNTATGEIIDREMTDAEYELFKADVEAMAQIQAEAEAKAAAKAAAEAKLAALGLDAEDLQALGL